MAPNACGNSSLPNAYGTNFPTPSDPYGQGYSNETALGWDGNYWPVFEYLSGSFFARGVPTTYNANGTTICGAMYSFSIYNRNGNRPAQSVQWTEEAGYLPAMTTSFTTGTTAVAIKEFADKVTIGGHPFGVVYARVSVTNNGVRGDHPSTPAASGAEPGAADQHLAEHRPARRDQQPRLRRRRRQLRLRRGASHRDARCRPAPRTSPPPTARWRPTGTAGSARPRPSRCPTSRCRTPAVWPTPGTAMTNAYKAGTVYILMTQIGEAQFSAANNYFWLLNHDVPGELNARLETGDFHDAQNLLLTARISQATNFDEHGANWYFDGDWKTPSTWAYYLAKTNDTAFVSQYFHDDAGGSSPWGPSLYTIMHGIYQGQLASDGVAGDQLRQRLLGPLAVRRLLGAGGPGRVQVHCDAHRQHRRGAVRRRRVHLAAERDRTRCWPATSRPTGSATCRAPSTSRTRPTAATPTTTPTGPRRCGSARTSGRRCSWAAR